MSIGQTHTTDFFDTGIGNLVPLSSLAAPGPTAITSTDGFWGGSRATLPVELGLLVVAAVFASSKTNAVLVAVDDVIVIATGSSVGGVGTGVGGTGGGSAWNNGIRILRCGITRISNGEAFQLTKIVDIFRWSLRQDDTQVKRVSGGVLEWFLNSTLTWT